jgi:DNA-binding beta-propeller fold protein YncE
MRLTRILSCAAAAILTGGLITPAGPAAAAVSLPPCTTSVASTSSLTPKTAMLSTAGYPFGVATTSDGQYAFVAASSPGSLLVLSTSTFKPTLVRTIPLNGIPAGVALSPNGQYLLVASGGGAIVISVAIAESGTGNPILGTLTGTGTSAIQVAFSADGNFVFVTLEYNSEAAVFNFAQVLASGFTTSGLVGYVPLGLEPVGMALSPDGDDLYVTSEQANDSSEEGTLSVIDVATAETDPAGSVLNTVDAGCNPVRVIVSADGKDVWVSARASDALLVFSASALQHSTVAAPLLAWTLVGEAPVDLHFVDNGTLIVVADSDRFNTQGETPDLGVVNVADVLAGQAGLVGKIASGQFPRELAVEANGKTLLASNYASEQLEAVDVSGLS